MTASPTNQYSHRRGASDSTDSFTDTEIYRTTRLARDHGFNSFDSGRAKNATYEDTRFFELQTLKADVDAEMDYAPVLTAGECVELIASALIPPD
ncbi:hypothetical protein GCM10009030_19670 [Haloarcula pellucida]|uniref:Uncharacterized protein n=1 Tax=Haloarcula pellucida TaxID=1427151 RepID=A0A830GJX4_9EURY|nr:hypothetical protein GCM10009030_19670 [Halomicroarcula pellucida]